MPLLTCIDDPQQLSEPDRQDMFDLMTRHYAQVRRGQFDADLDEKQWVIRLFDPATGTLRGFSTQLLLAATVHGRRVKALFSGDTIIDPQAWGTPALPLAWGRLAFSIIQQHPKAELYWFLITQGYKTYRFLPVFFRDFYPRFDRATPPAIRHTMDALAFAKFPHTYRCDTGIVHNSGRGYRLREGLADVTIHRLSDPHVRHFVQCNPGHARGDELVCLAPLTTDNFTTIARRLSTSARFADIPAP